MDPVDDGLPVMLDTDVGITDALDLARADASIISRPVVVDSPLSLMVQMPPTAQSPGRPQPARPTSAPASGLPATID